MSAFVMAMRFQWWAIRSTVDARQAFILAPLFTVIFVGIVVSAGRPDLVAGAALGATLISLWSVCLQLGGSMIDQERWSGTFEPLAAAPTPLRVVILGRVTTVALCAIAVIPEVWLTVLVVFHRAIAVPRPGLMIVSVALVLIGLAATANLVAALFVLARTALYLQNAFTYPMFILGGLLVPVSVLPGWLQPFSRIVFLSWGGDLMRTALSIEPPVNIGGRLLALAITALVTFAAGQLLLTRVLDRSRRRGSLSLA